MGHCIRAIIGAQPVIQELADDWVHAKEIPLPQGYGMVFLIDPLLDDIEDLLDASETLSDADLAYFSEMEGFTSATAYFLQKYSFRTKLAYVETDYFGGVGTQAGILYENGKIRIPPQSGDGTINLLLKELGVWCVHGKDEFDSLKLGIYRRMDR